MASALTAGQIAGLGSLFTGMNFVGSIAGSNLSAHKASKLAQLQAALNYKYNKKWALEGAGYNRQGLEAAGYNPMLAVQNGTSGANANFASANSSQDIDFSGDIASGIANAQSFQRLKNETDVASSQQDVNYANADKIKAEKATLVERLPFVSKQAKADYMKTEMESAKLENDIHYQNEYLNYLDNSLKLQQRLGEMGLYVQMRGQDKVYNASTYSADKAYKSSVYASGLSHPYSKILHKTYNSGRDYKGSYSDPWSN